MQRTSLIPRTLRPPPGPSLASARTTAKSSGPGVIPPSRCCQGRGPLAARTW